MREKQYNRLPVQQRFDIGNRIDAADTTFEKRHFCTKLKCNLTSAIEISQHNGNIVVFAISDRKKVTNFLIKLQIFLYQRLRSQWNVIKFNIYNGAI